MLSIAVSFYQTFLIALIITGLQTLFLQIFYVQMIPCQNGMEWGCYGLILASHNFWPWIESLSMDVKINIFVVLVP